MGKEKKGIIGNAFAAAVTVISILSVVTLLLGARNVHQCSILYESTDNDGMLVDLNPVMMDPAPRTKCVPWTKETASNRTVQPIDEWWVHNVAWFSHSTNETHACWIEEIRRSKRRDLAHEIYVNQHLRDCSRIHYRIMWSSGWGADMKNVINSLRTALTDYRLPLVMGWDFEHPQKQKGWHYAVNKERDITFPNGTVDYSRLNPTCPEKDLTCYFLPYHSCGSLDGITPKRRVFVGEIRQGYRGLVEDNRHYYEWVLRPLVSFRRAVFDYQKDQGLASRLSANLEHRGQCSVIHVRRADIIFHGDQSRRYFPISDYVDKLPEIANKQHLVLLTDDANAIEEALEFFPDRTWYFYNRTRHRGSSGGWEHQIPSLNPAQEMITMFATFDLMEQYCSHLVYGLSSFAEFLWHFMQRKQDDELIPVFRHRVEQNTSATNKESNKNSELELAEQLEAVRHHKGENEK